MTAREALKHLKEDSFIDFEEYGINEDMEALSVAIEALEKQIPKKPNKEVETSWGIKREVNVCPVCDYYLSEINFIGDGKKVSYCEVCGQAIDWENLERSDEECSG